MVTCSRIKTKINSVFDANIFIDLMAVAGSRLMIKYALLRGCKINAKYGNNTELPFSVLEFHQGQDRKKRNCV